MWDEILWLRQCVTVSQSSCSCILQTRFKMLLAISQMQVREGGGGHRGPGLPWEQRVPQPGKPHALPALPTAWSAAGPGAPALSPPGSTLVTGQWGVRLHGNLVQRGWGLPMGALMGRLVSSGQRGNPRPPPGHPDPQSAPGSPLTHCFLLPSHPITQGLLGIQDLGQVFFEPVKDKQGNILIVTLKEVKTNQTFESVRWVPICKLQTSRKSVSSPEEPTALDTLLISVQVPQQCRRGGASWWAPLRDHQCSRLPCGLEGPWQSPGYRGFGGGRRQRWEQGPVALRGGSGRAGGRAPRGEACESSSAPLLRTSWLTTSGAAMPSPRASTWAT